MNQTTITKRTREAKINAGSASYAMKMARDNNDQLWKKANKFKKLFMNAKKAIMTKYGSRARQEYVKRANSSNSSSGSSKKSK